MRDTNLVNALREQAEWARANVYEAPIALYDDLTEAADTLEKLRGQNEQLREAAALVKDWSDLCTIVGECGGIDRVRALAEADRGGRLVVLPCKVGDTVYFALLGRIIEKQVFSIVSFSNSIRIYCDGTSEYFRPEDIGKTFFLTHEQAEKALEAMKDE